MIFKKFIGALTALVMTMTAFVGLATEVGAAFVTQETAYSLVLDFGNEIKETLYTNDPNDLTLYTENGYTFTHNTEKYIVTDSNIQYVTTPEFGVTVTATVARASTITIEIQGDGTVNIDGTTYQDNDEFTAAIGTSHTIVAEATDESIVKNISLSSDPNADWAITLDKKTATRTATMPNENATLNVTFGNMIINNITIKVQNGSTTDFGGLGINCGTVTLVGHSTTEDGTFQANSGDTITVVTNPETGYELMSVTVINSNDDSDVQVQATNDTYTFIMPDAPVTVTASFQWTNVLPDEATLNFIDNFADDTDSPTASLWEGRLTGRGSPFKPLVSVTSNNDTKQVLGTTEISGNGSVFVAIVVDKARNEIDSISLTGVDPTTEINSNGTYDEYNQSDDTTEGGNE